MDDFLKQLEKQVQDRYNERQERIEQLMFMAIARGGKLPSELADELFRLMAMQKTHREFMAKSDESILEDFENFKKKSKK